MQKHNKYQLINIIQSYIITLTFIVIVFAPVCNDIFSFISSEDVNENRVKTQKPKLRLTDIGSFPEKFDEYYECSFNLRTELLSINSELRLKLFNTSPFPNTVIIGKRGWYYHMKYIDVYEAKIHFDKEELWHFKNMFDQRLKWLNEKGIKMYCAIIPVKTSIYPEYLPNFILKHNPINKTDSLINYLTRNSKVKIIDLRKVLLEDKIKNNIRLFHRTDQHWNDYGAFVAAKAIIDTIHNDFPEVNIIEIEDYKIDSFLRNGYSLARILLKSEEIQEMEITVVHKDGFKAFALPKKGYKPPETFPYKNEYEYTYKVEGLDAPKIYVVRDSYTAYMKKYLSEYFNESFYLWDQWVFRLDKEIIENEKPDIVIFALIEADINRMIYGVNEEHNMKTRTFVY